jgi:aminopeptidase N
LRAADLGGYVHETQHAPYAFDDTVIRLRFDIANGIVYGDETAVIRTRQSLDILPFNTKGIHYEAVTVDSMPVAYSIDERNELLNVRLSKAVAARTRLVVEFRYEAKPERGMYFIRPDRAYPHIVPQIWTQGEPTDNRRWFPTWDEPNLKTPSELIVEVPRGWTVIGNGYLKSHTTEASKEIWDWYSPRPKSTYLIAFVAGPLVKWHDALGSLDIDSFVKPSDARLNALCFRDTKKMIAYYERLTGVAYPFEKYDQIMTERYTFGGMEDSSDTILTELALHPAVEDVEDSCDYLISHELAQQWYGDDATMADWSNAWLNEGFATYYDELWTGERYGVADFEYARYNAQQAYFAEARRYMRPIVDYKYSDPLQLFDASGHERPAQALHMLRSMFGDARFFGAVDAYLREYAYRNADTREFFASIGRTLGTDLTWFEDEWFYRASYPHYYVSDAYDKRDHVLRIHVEQKNPDGKPFSMPIIIEVFAGLRTIEIEPTIDRNEQDLVVHGVPATPQMVLFDPDNNVLRQLTFPKTFDELAYQLAHATHVGDREWALQQLAAYTGAARTEADAAVARSVAADSFWGMRADAAGVAASFDDVDAVVRALHDPDVRVRIAAENSAALLVGKPPAVIAELERLSNDANPDVARAALSAIGTLQPAGSFELLVAALGRTSFQEAVASGALAGLAASCDHRALTLIRARTAYGTQEQERAAAVRALAQCAVHLKNPNLVLAQLVALASEDQLISTRIAAIDALGTLHDKAAIPGLRSVARTDSQEIVRENAEAVIESLAH